MPACEFSLDAFNIQHLADRKQLSCNTSFFAFCLVLQTLRSWRNFLHSYRFSIDYVCTHFFRYSVSLPGSSGLQIPSLHVLCIRTMLQFQFTYNSSWSWGEGDGSVVYTHKHTQLIINTEKTIKHSLTVMQT